jgi:hypothetical protein
MIVLDWLLWLKRPNFSWFSHYHNRVVLNITKIGACTKAQT